MNTTPPPVARDTTNAICVLLGYDPHNVKSALITTTQVRVTTFDRDPKHGGYVVVTDATGHLDAATTTHTHEITP